MKTIAAMTVTVALLATACGGDDGGNGAGPPGGGLPTTGPVSIAPDLPVREGPGGYVVPDVEPSIPGLEGGPTGVDSQVLDQGLDDFADGMSSRPVVLLARTPQEANGIIEKTPPSAREVVTGFNAWGERALLIFTGGAQPDARYRIVLRDLSVIEGGRTIQVFGAFRRRSGKRSSDPVVPWVVASLDVRATVNAEGCVLSFPEVSAITTNCH